MGEAAQRYQAAQAKHAELRAQRESAKASAAAGELVDVATLGTLDASIAAYESLLPDLQTASAAELEQERADEWQRAGAEYLRAYRSEAAQFWSAARKVRSVLNELVAAGAAVDNVVSTAEKDPRRPAPGPYEQFRIDGVPLPHPGVGDVVLGFAGDALDQCPGRPWGEFRDQFRTIRREAVVPPVEIEESN